jgi:flagellar assembly factor FliW
MSLTIESSRFGTVEIDPETVVEFPDGLIGLGGHRYALLRTDPSSPFLWLQSLDDPGIALPVTNPHTFFADYKVELADDDAEQIGLPPDAGADVYVTVTAAPVAEEITVNLKAPILIHEGRAHQMINQAEGAKLKAHLFPPSATEPASA